MCGSWAAGERTSYGRAYELAERADIATVPVGYADGVPRSLFDGGGEVLIGGRRRRVAGSVTMDQLMVDCGPDSGVRHGDEVVLIGSQGAETVTAQEWADRIGTISFEILCRIGPRLPRKARPRRHRTVLVLPGGRRAVAWATAGVFSAVGVGYALSRRYSRRQELATEPAEDELAVPGDVVHRVLRCATEPSRT